MYKWLKSTEMTKDEWWIHWQIYRQIHKKIHLNNSIWKLTSKFASQNSLSKFT